MENEILLKTLINKVRDIKKAWTDAVCEVKKEIELEVEEKQDKVA